MNCGVYSVPLIMTFFWQGVAVTVGGWALIVLSFFLFFLISKKRILLIKE